jgi:hypothetical protein
VSSTTQESRPITKNDIRAKFAELQGSAGEQVDQAQSAIALAAVATVGALIVAAFVLGRRRGRKKQTIVEIKRV